VADAHLREGLRLSGVEGLAFRRPAKLFLLSRRARRQSRITSVRSETDWNLRRLTWKSFIPKERTL
jgi:hypothetical protein